MRTPELLEALANALQGFGHFPLAEEARNRARQLTKEPGYELPRECDGCKYRMSSAMLEPCQSCIDRIGGLHLNYTKKEIKS